MLRTMPTSQNRDMGHPAPGAKELTRTLKPPFLLYRESAKAEAWAYLDAKARMQLYFGACEGFGQWRLIR